MQFGFGLPTRGPLANPEGVRAMAVQKRPLSLLEHPWRLPRPAARRPPPACTLRAPSGVGSNPSAGFFLQNLLAAPRGKIRPARREELRQPVVVIIRQQLFARRLTHDVFVSLKILPSLFQRPPVFFPSSPQPLDVQAEKLDGHADSVGRPVLFLASVFVGLDTAVRSHARQRRHFGQCPGVDEIRDRVVAFPLPATRVVLCWGKIMRGIARVGSCPTETTRNHVPDIQRARCAVLRIALWDDMLDLSPACRDFYLAVAA